MVQQHHWITHYKNINSRGNSMYLLTLLGAKLKGIQILKFLNLYQMLQLIKTRILVPKSKILMWTENCKITLALI